MGNEFFTQLTDHCSERQYEPEPARMARLSNELQQRKAQITEDLLGLKHTKLFWDSVNAQLFVPGVDAAVNNLRAVMDPVDAAWRAKPVGERGCQFWSGIEGSCLQPGCQAQHVPGQPSAWYAARAQVWQQLGCKPDEKGNYRLPTAAGYKRPALTDAGAESVTSRSFRR
ncbi:hypothetical protein OEZ86_009485 [Tetradesmus obliquus]|nr:hypothetical protein OEZ85_002650 [Tetradesmus obliquus]WIA42224.1 hypothetical protein OEZ86_009482 [Tetradesmus obliquus]WIA42227.1 hypothetical protein OEZ86_009485 [Tetradesmus obliquus]